LGRGPISAGGRAGASLGEVATGGAPIPNSAKKFADTLVLAFGVTVQLPIPLHAPPQPANSQPLAGEAVRVTCVPAAKLALQVEPQSIPAGAHVTAPPELPITDTERACDAFCVNIANTFGGAFGGPMVSVQEPVPLHGGGSIEADIEPHPEKVQPLAGVAVRVTCVPEANVAVQVVGQSMPEGELITVPLPVSLTVSAKLPVFSAKTTPQPPAHTVPKPPE